MSKTAVGTFDGDGSSKLKAGRVARTDDFARLLQEMCLAIAHQEPQAKIQGLLDEAKAKMGEEIAVGRFSRFEIGEK